MKMQGVNERLEHYSAEVHRLTIDGQHDTEILQGLDDFVATAHQLVERIDTMDHDERAELVRLVVDRVVVKGDGLQVVMALDLAGGGYPTSHRADRHRYHRSPGGQPAGNYRPVSRPGRLGSTGPTREHGGGGARRG